MSIVAISVVGLYEVSVIDGHQLPVKSPVVDSNLAPMKEHGAVAHYSGFAALEEQRTLSAEGQILPQELRRRPSGYGGTGSRPENTFPRKIATANTAVGLAKACAWATDSQNGVFWLTTELMHYVYILRSESDLSRHYVGYTADLKRRIKEHHSATQGFTAECGDWASLVLRLSR